MIATETEWSITAGGVIRLAISKHLACIPYNVADVRTLSYSYCVLLARWTCLVPGQIVGCETKQSHHLLAPHFRVNKDKDDISPHSIRN